MLFHHLEAADDLLSVRMWNESPKTKYKLSLRYWTQCAFTQSLSLRQLEFWKCAVEICYWDQFSLATELFKISTVIYDVFGLKVFFDCFGILKAWNWFDLSILDQGTWVFAESSMSRVWISTDWKISDLIFWILK